MSRHRDVRSMEYSNYIDTYDDLSEDSMEEDYAVSPSVQQFIYDRNKEGAITSFFNHLDNEDNKVVCDVVYDEAALKICRDAIGDLLVDIISESELKKRIYKFNYNVEAVINSVLNEPNEGLRSYNLSDSKLKSIFSKHDNQSTLNQKDMSVDNKWQIDTDCKNNELKTIPSIFDKPETSKSSEIDSENNCSGPSATDLSTYYSKMSEKKTNSSSGFVIPKMNFNTSKPRRLDVDSENKCSGPSATDLNTYYSKMSENKTNSSSGFVIPKMNFNTSKPKHIDSNSIPSFNCLSNLITNLNVSNKNEEDSTESFDSPSSSYTLQSSLKNTHSDDAISFDSLASLTTHHLKAFNDNKSERKYVSSPIDFISKIKKDESNNLLSSDFVENSATSSKTDKKSINSNFNLISQNFSKNEQQENCIIDCNVQNLSDLVIKNISNLTCEEKKNNLVGDNKLVCNTNNKNTSNNIIELTKQVIHNEYISNYVNYANFKLLQPVSPFGKVLCKKYKKHTICGRKEIRSIEDYNTILRFDFSSPSPYSA